MTNIDYVTKSWDIADPNYIHPLRAEHPEEYWASGMAQANDAAAWLDWDGDYPPRVIDFGCGDGRLTIPLAEMGAKVIAVDASDRMLNLLADNVIAQDARQPYKIIHSNGLDLDQRMQNEDDVDLVLARAVLIHHNYESVGHLVRSLAGVIAPGGHFIADWPVADKPHEGVDWIDVTTWEWDHRDQVAASAGLELVDPNEPSVWRKI